MISGQPHVRVLRPASREADPSTAADAAPTSPPVHQDPVGQGDSLDQFRDRAATHGPRHPAGSGRGCADGRPAERGLTGRRGRRGRGGPTGGRGSTEYAGRRGGGDCRSRYRSGPRRPGADRGSATASGAGRAADGPGLQRQRSWCSAEQCHAGGRRRRHRAPVGGAAGGAVRAVPVPGLPELAATAAGTLPALRGTDRLRTGGRPRRRRQLPRHPPSQHARLRRPPAVRPRAGDPGRRESGCPAGSTESRRGRRGSASPSARPSTSDSARTPPASSSTRASRPPSGPAKAPRQS